jgi:pseudaminic acid cytidylyltransferase
MKIAVIPARGGSKRIPRKNIKEFCGNPMIAWSIRAAMESNLFDHIVVSTDDVEIAEIAKDCGAEVPFMRPNNLADDYTPTVPVIAHAIESCNKLGWGVDFACCIYPGAPFLQVADLVSAFQLIEERAANFVFPVAEYAHPIQRAMRHMPDGSMQFISPQFELTRTQDLERTYHDAGQFYWGTSAAWLAKKKMHTDGLGMPIPNWRVVDIDSEDDWIRAEIIFNSLFMQAQDSK